MTEKEFLAQVIALAQLCGFRVAHFRPGLRKDGSWRTAVQGDGKGFPDLLLLHPKRGTMLVAELKVNGRSATLEQQTWLADFELAGVPSYLWRPSDWPAIERILKGE